MALSEITGPVYSFETRAFPGTGPASSAAAARAAGRPMRMAVDGGEAADQRCRHARRCGCGGAGGAPVDGHETEIGDGTPECV